MRGENSSNWIREIEGRRRRDANMLSPRSTLVA
jgi:hypothetical protein